MDGTGDIKCLLVLIDLFFRLFICRSNDWVLLIDAELWGRKVFFPSMYGYFTCGGCLSIIPINNCEIDLREMKGLKRIRGCKIYTTPSIPSIRKLNLIVCHFGYRNCIQIYTISENCIESFLILFVKSKYYLFFVGKKKDIVKHRKGKNWWNSFVTILFTKNLYKF